MQTGEGGSKVLQCVSVTSRDELDLFYGKANFGFGCLCILIGKILLKATHSVTHLIIIFL